MFQFLSSPGSKNISLAAVMLETGAERGVGHRMEARSMRQTVHKVEMRRRQISVTEFFHEYRRTYGPTVGVI
jgi:hypothetical protein